MNENTLTNLTGEENCALASRRKFLRQLAGGALLAVSGSDVVSAAARQVYAPSYKIIALENNNTGDKLNLMYYERGHYVRDALQEISHLFRDFHTGEVHPIDPLLLDQLHDLKQALGIYKPFEVISGYRSPDTNANLRRQSHRVAKHSLHMEGRAIDIRVQGLDTRHIKNAAIAMARGGVGYYPDANFVHLDTGEIRTW